MPPTTKPALSRAARWLTDIISPTRGTGGALDEAYGQLLEGHPRRALTAFQAAAQAEPKLVPALLETA
ncbi:MAG: hypothetical protein QF724_08535 [Planctomycetota bacterium]|jgi:hypothetical protein|nr:hypothetical protein [Planctomycetota bacterium]MDP6369768.1 hypothetical protein [Planctomycetota bacterium]MDP6518889.1 hypothetical protein [Planctomycetota bacterium]MDP6838968.1 hypothetical protein [Planctomycetota bacterium]MDP6957110.1 hypothetical protein [Planctomycetota bacterium]